MPPHTSGPRSVSSTQAAELLGVQVQTVYAYVSRGILHRADPSARHAGTRLRLEEVEALAARHRRDRSGVYELAIATEITRLDPEGVLLYRGHEATELARRSSFEEVAEILWDTDEPTPVDWPDDEAFRAVAGEAARLTPHAAYADRIRLAVQLAALDDERRADLSPDGIRRAGRRALRTAAHALAPSPGPEPATSTARLVAAGLCSQVPAEAEADVLRTALVLLADHELATSTLAARAAASTGADTYLVLLAGLAAMGGERHGAASRSAERLVRDAVAAGPDDVEIPAQATGFGHSVYRDLDPRADALLDAVAALAPEVVEAVDRLALRMRRERGTFPNVDLALGAMVVALDLPPGAGEAAFMIARMAGFVAHTLEEQDHGLRFRPRAVYSGRDGSGPT